MKIARWRFYLIAFLFLTLSGVTFDCVYEMPLRNVIALFSHNAILPGLIAVVLYLVELGRKS